MRSGGDVVAKAEVGDGRLDVLEAVGGVFEQMWDPFAIALVGGVEGGGDEAGAGQAFGVEARGLLLHSAHRVGDDDGGTLFAKRT
ncbi:hypothetical protein GCM10009609_31630 [Pseudonocardia aurantiaca]